MTEDTPAVELADYFTEEQITQLLAAINPSRISVKESQSHLESYDVRAHLTRILGFGRWDGEVTDSWQLFEEIDGEKKWNPEKKGRNGSTYAGWDDLRKITVGYRVRYRLVVKAPDGTELARYTEEAAGDANNFPGTKRADAHDFAVKTAESQALKRCAINLGDQFGLSLYRKGSTNALVLRTLVGMPTAGRAPAAEQVDAGAPDVVPEEHPDHADEHHEQPRQQVGPPPTVDELLIDADMAPSADALNSLARRAVAVHAAGHLTDQQLAALKTAVTARRTALAQPTLPTGDAA